MQGVSLGPLVLAADRAAVLAGLAVLLILTGILGRRREGVSIYYFIANEKVVHMCRTICVQIAIEQN